MHAEKRYKRKLLSFYMPLPGVILLYTTTMQALHFYMPQPGVILLFPISRRYAVICHYHAGVVHISSIYCSQKHDKAIKLKIYQEKSFNYLLEATAFYYLFDYRKTLPSFR